MALKEIYLAIKDKIASDGSEFLYVMRNRGNNELAPSKELLEEFNSYKHDYNGQQGYPNKYWYAWGKSNYEERFRQQTLNDNEAMDRLQKLSEESHKKDIYLICYEGNDKPCHRRILLQIAKEKFDAEVKITGKIKMPKSRR